MQDKFPITNTFVKYFFSYVLVIILSVVLIPLFKNIFGVFYPEELGGSLFDVRFSFDAVYGFIIAYSFFLPLVLIPVFPNSKVWLKLLIPYLPVLIVAFLFIDKAANVSIIFFVIGALLGLLAIWIKKKL